MAVPDIHHAKSILLLRQAHFEVKIAVVKQEVVQLLRL